MSVEARPGKVTERDIQALAWIGRWAFVTADQLAVEFAMSGQVARRRLRVLRSLGLIGYERPLSSEPGAYFLDREGMETVGLSGPVVGPKIAQFTHDRMLVDLAQELRSKHPLHEFVTEREMRRLDTVNQSDNRAPKYAIFRTTAKSRQRIYPDLVSITSKGTELVHELEVSRKDVNRLSRLMLAYAHTQRIAGVRYYCSPLALPNVSRAAEETNTRMSRTGAGQRIWVEQWPMADTNGQ